MEFVGKVGVLRVGKSLTWECAPDKIDGDGCPTAYHLHGKGLDYLANAYKDPRPGPGEHYGEPGFKGWNSCVLTVDKDDPKSAPVLQVEDGQPAPGFLVTRTALVDRAFPEHDQRRYVDAAAVPYISVPPELLALGCHVGDLCLASLGQYSVAGLIADVGPHRRLGEVSIAMAMRLGIRNCSPRNGGTSVTAHFAVFCETSKGWPREAEEIIATVGQLAGPGVTLVGAACR